MNVIKHYTNGEVTIVWEPERCIHSAICFRGLPTVFKPKDRPWVVPTGAPTGQIIAQIEACPSGALRYFRNEAEPGASQPVAEARVEVLPNGPLLVYGNLTVKDRDGNETKKTKTTAFCRCGASTHKPYCDGSHLNSGFQG